VEKKKKLVFIPSFIFLNNHEKNFKKFDESFTLKLRNQTKDIKRELALSLFLLYKDVIKNLPGHFALNVRHKQIS